MGVGVPRLDFGTRCCRLPPNGLDDGSGEREDDATELLEEETSSGEEELEEVAAEEEEEIVEEAAHEEVVVEEAAPLDLTRVSSVLARVCDAAARNNALLTLSLRFQQWRRFTLAERTSTAAKIMVLYWLSFQLSRGFEMWRDATRRLTESEEQLAAAELRSRISSGPLCAGGGSGSCSRVSQC